MNLVDVKRPDISGARFRVRFKLPNGCDCEVFLGRPDCHSIEPIARVLSHGMDPLLPRKRLTTATIELSARFAA
jgi:hypothetical protein